MVGLQNRITVAIIRNAAGSQSGSTYAGCRDSAPSYFAAARLSTELPSSCGSNTYGLYDPLRPRKVINVMNFFGAPSSDFVPFYRSNMDETIDLNCELQPGDEIICVWKPLVVLGPLELTTGLFPPNNPGKRVIKPLLTMSSLTPKLPIQAKVTVKRAPGSTWLPTYGIYFKSSEA